MEQIDKALLSEIDKKIRSKINFWIDSISDPEIRSLCRENSFLAGGAIASHLLNKQPRDYDIYFKNVESAQKVITYYLKLYDFGYSTFENLVEENSLFTKDNYGLKINIRKQSVFVDFAKECTPTYPIYISSTALTLSDDIQLIFRFCGDPQKVFSFFDFAHCTNYWDDVSGLHLNPKAVEAIQEKKLVYVGKKFPINSLSRIRKFILLGWTISSNDVKEVCSQILKLNFTDLKVLEEQWIGVSSPVRLLLTIRNFLSLWKNFLS